MEEKILSHATDAAEQFVLWAIMFLPIFYKHKLFLQHLIQNIVVRLDDIGLEMGFGGRKRLHIVM